MSKENKHRSRCIAAMLSKEEHRQFRLACMIKGVSQCDMMRVLIAEWLMKNPVSEQLCGIAGCAARTPIHPEIFENQAKGE